MDGCTSNYFTVPCAERPNKFCIFFVVPYHKYLRTWTANKSAHNQTKVMLSQDPKTPRTSRCLVCARTVDMSEIKDNILILP